jgi:hypothetical protein
MRNTIKGIECERLNGGNNAVVKQGDFYPDGTRIQLNVGMRIPDDEFIWRPLPPVIDLDQLAEMRKAGAI